MTWYVMYKDLYRPTSSTINCTGDFLKDGPNQKSLVRGFDRRLSLEGRIDFYFFREHRRTYTQCNIIIKSHTLS